MAVSQTAVDVTHRGIDTRHSHVLWAPIRHQLLDRLHAAVARPGSVLQQPAKAKLWHRFHVFHGDGAGNQEVRYDALRYQPAFTRLPALDEPAACRLNLLGQRYFKGLGIFHLEDQSTRRLQDCAFSFY